MILVDKDSIYSVERILDELVMIKNDFSWPSESLDSTSLLYKASKWLDSLLLLSLSREAHHFRAAKAVVY